MFSRILFRKVSLTYFNPTYELCIYSNTINKITGLTSFLLVFKIDIHYSKWECTYKYKFRIFGSYISIEVFYQG